MGESLKTHLNPLIWVPTHMTQSYECLILESLKTHSYEWDSNIRVSKDPLIHTYMSTYSYDPLISFSFFTVSKTPLIRVGL